MRASIPTWSSGRTTAGASRSPRGTASRSTSTRCCARGSSRTASRAPDEVHETEPGRRGRVLERGARRASCCARIRDGELSVREERGLGLPWSPRAGRARPARGRRARSPRRGTRSSTASRMNLGGGTHHAGRAFARGYCLFNDVAVALARAARRGPRRARAGRRLRRPPGRRHRRPARPATRTRSRSRCTARATTRSSASRPTSTSTSPTRHRRRRLPRGARRARSTSRCRRARADIAFYLAGADPWEGDRLGRLALTKAGPARPRRARARPPARRRRRGLRRARRRLRGGRRATPSTSTRRPPPRSRQG